MYPILLFRAFDVSQYQINLARSMIRIRVSQNHASHFHPIIPDSVCSLAPLYTHTHTVRSYIHTVHTVHTFTYIHTHLHLS